MTPCNLHHGRAKRCAAWLVPLSTLAGVTQASEFDAGFLRDPVAASALAKLNENAALAAGEYLFDVALNGEALGKHRLTLEPTEAKGWRVCLPLALLEQGGVNLVALATPPAPGTTCIDLEEALPDSKVTTDTRHFKVAVSVPQIAIQRRLHGTTDPDTWDRGITAGYLNYQASTHQGTSHRQGKNVSHDLYLNAGVNLGDWRLRSTQSLNDSDRLGRTWQRSNTYAQRDLPTLRANFTVGELFTQGEVFRSVPMLGMQVASDMDMLPDVLQAYSPVIRGVAQTRAKVEVRRDGYLLYSTYVPAGPFALDDLSVSGSGELDVTVIEDDGQVTRFTQPYSTLANLLRDGVWRYSAAVGRYDPAYSNSSRPMLAQGSVARGMAGNWTLYGGAMGASFYQAGQLGASRDFGAWGALSLDATAATTAAEKARYQGMSYAARYGKAFTTGTQLRFAGYRYSTEGYRDFDEAVVEQGSRWLRHGSRRSRLEGAIYQNLGTRTSLSLSMSQEDYWGSAYKRQQLQANLSTVAGGVGLNFYASQTFDERNREYRQLGLSVSVPLGSTRSSATFSTQRSGERLSQNASLAGYHTDLKLGYRASVTQGDQQNRTGSFSANWQGPVANLGAAVSRSSEFSSLSLNASGSLVLHPGGVVAAPQVSDTFALVEVPGIEGVGVRNGAGRTNAAGYTVANSLRPYRPNTVSLDTSNLGPDVLIDNGTQQVIPRRGAVVKTTFSGRRVTRVLLTARLPDGNKLAFGTEFLDRDGAWVATVGQGGQALLESTDEPQTLMARWGDDGGQRCLLKLDPGKASQQQGYYLLDAVCAP
ncbi:fimbria/pilus outer membrane usher protein [Pseudomonas japonica]|uniref:fimbria/pilus outer membrane usher protein n=1 Tax=Pseudomonas japonica TaxID=256466 RepID=UPI0015E2AFEC|nr:fimbria/pilus outer membrane usher protein [Pseudomonas japonica]MBA1287309.1 fimbrial biogenesis outer membrane usher protein [Pseudomonas japonica]